MQVTVARPCQASPRETNPRATASGLWSLGEQATRTEGPTETIGLSFGESMSADPDRFMREQRQPSGE